MLTIEALYTGNHLTHRTKHRAQWSPYPGEQVETGLVNIGRILNLVSYLQLSPPVFKTFHNAGSGAPS